MASPRRGVGKARPILDLNDEKLTGAQNDDIKISHDKLTVKEVCEIDKITHGTGCQLYSAPSPEVPFTDVPLRVNWDGPRGAGRAKVVNGFHQIQLTDFDCFNVQEHLRSSPVKYSRLHSEEGCRNDPIPNYLSKRSTE